MRLFAALPSGLTRDQQEKAGYVLFNKDADVAHPINKGFYAGPGGYLEVLDGADYMRFKPELKDPSEVVPDVERMQRYLETLEKEGKNASVDDGQQEADNVADAVLKKTKG